MDRNTVIAIVGGITAVVLGLVLAVYFCTTASTKRETECVSHGGSYVLVPNTTKMECDR